MPYGSVLWSLKRQKHDPFMVERSVDEVALASGDGGIMPGCTASGGREGIMTNEATEDQDLEQPMRAATEALRETVLRLLRVGEVHPQLILLAMARVTGELAAAAALAGGRELEPLLGELAEVVRHAGREHHRTLQAEMLPVAGSA
jgi:hypothetical protein